ncbi:Transcriptional activator protein CopR [Gammaproteobacteria bacterium]
MHLLMVEDNPDLVANVVDFLEDHGHTLDIAYNGFSALGFALEKNYDAMILDLMLPGLSGFEVCSKLRNSGLSIPILMLTARDGLDDKLEGFACGADDYLIKPFALLELEARLLAIARRGQSASLGEAAEHLRVADLDLDLATRRLTRAESVLDLPPIPMKLLEALMRRAPHLVSRAELERTIWGDEPPDSDALRAHLHLLRQIIDKPFSHPLLHTVRGFGYRLGDDEKL